MVQRSIVLRCAAVTALLGGCEAYQPDYDNLPCQENDCLADFVCHPELQVCVRPIVAGCGGENLCASLVVAGDTCPHVNAFIPCADERDDCALGCRTCQEDLTWSLCSNECLASSAEICDGIDNDCNEKIDDIDASTLDDYCDELYTGAHVAAWLCNSGCAAVTCDEEYYDMDGDPGCEYHCVLSGAEICDGADNDCDGESDNGLDLAGCTDFGRDEDQDGFSVAGDSRCLCVATAPYIGLGPATDCDDTDPTSHPDVATEACDGNDNDCDAVVPTDELDEDSDGFVVCSSWLDTQGDDPTIFGGDDCDDDPGQCGSACYPQTGVVDACDGHDNDCDGTPDDDPELIWYEDADGDGFTAASQAACADPDGAGTTWLATATTTDCDDNPLACGDACYPGNLNPDVCDGVDQDCADGSDEDPDLIWYEDVDGDGHTGSNTQTRCDDPDGAGARWLATATTDCDDNDPASHPGVVTEACDGNDNDCDTVVPTDELDEDSDGFVVCSGWLDTQGDDPMIFGGDDCDDNPGQCGPACYPQTGVVDDCDGHDNDCDGTPDDDPELTWYEDADGDGFTAASQAACVDPDGAGATWLATATTTDCDDNPLACGNGCYPGNLSPDVCDGDDQDCADGSDEDPDLIWYEDVDGDGHTGSNTQTRCDDPDGVGTRWLATATTDCDDADSASHPSIVTEACDGNDNDCDTVVPTDELDEDSDGFVVCSGWLDTQGDDPTVSGGDDCDDNPSQCGSACYPQTGVLDDCDGHDNDCDGTPDDDPELTWYEDADGDGFTAASQDACVDPDGAGTTWLATATTSDCDDNDAASHPTATEVCDGNDNDCDTVLPADESDADSDDYVACTPWNDTQGDDSAMAGGNDCQDDEGARFPGNPEVCDNLDNNCDTTVDEGLANCACTAGGGPRAYEVCGDGVDDDCDAEIDEVGCVDPWWDCSYAYRLPIEVEVGASNNLWIGYSLRVVIDHAALVAAGKSLASGDDIRLVYYDGATQTEIDRALDPESSWNSATTEIWFGVQETLNNGFTYTPYMIYYGNASPAAPLKNEADVFDFADFFDRADNESVNAAGAAWNVNQVASTDIDLYNNQLYFESPNDALHRPYAEHFIGTFGGRLTLRFGFDWQRGDDTDYRIYIQLINDTVPYPPPSPAQTTPPHTGDVSLNLVSAAQGEWHYDEDPIHNFAHEGFGYIDELGELHQVDVVDNNAAVTALLDHSTKTFDLSIREDGTQRDYADLPLHSTIVGCNFVRFMSFRVGSGAAWSSQRGFDYVIVHRTLANDVIVTTGTEQPNLC